MPKYLYTIIALALVFWFWLWKYLNATPPDTFLNIFTGLGIAFTALALTLSIPFYLYFYKKAPTFSNLKMVYRRSFKRGLFFSAAIIFYLALRIFNLSNVFTIGLLVIFFVLLYNQLSSRK